MLNMRFIGMTLKFVAERLISIVFWQRPQPVPVRSVSTDHPWGGDGNRRQVRWPNITMRSNFLTILLLFIAAVPLKSAEAQTTVLPEPEVVVLQSETGDLLSEASLEAARDYQDFIDRLERLLYDYQYYFSKVEDYHARKYEGILQKMIFEINEGVYCSDIEVVSDDLENLIDDLEEHEDHFRDDVGDPKLYKLARKLRRELEVYYDELHEEILERLAEDITRNRIEKYLTKERASFDDARKIYIKTLAARTKLLEQVQKAISELEIEEALASAEYEELRIELADLAKEMEK